MFCIQLSSLNDLRDFMRAHSLSVLSPFEKVTKKKAENNLFQFCFTLRKYFVTVICRHFTSLKGLKVLKLGHNSNNETVIFTSMPVNGHNLHAKYDVGSCGSPDSVFSLQCISQTRASVYETLCP